MLQQKHNTRASEGTGGFCGHKLFLLYQHEAITNSSYSLITDRMAVTQIWGVNIDGFHRWLRGCLC